MSGYLDIANLKLPSAAIGMEVAEVKPSTKEGDVISTIAMAGKEWKLAVVPLIIGIIFSAYKISTSVAVPVCVLCSIFAAKYLYKHGKISA